ncbi:MAG: NAD(P)H-quinone oxidoreductase, partial [Acidobacteria bacterium]|nr:NAD(P)H-quinone oxidoreductase [Acidobacteriota bacterium]
MRAVLPESAELPRLGEVPDPRPAAGEVLLDVAAAALNRADLLQLKGLYPPPAGESPIPGLECAGTVLEVGPGVSRFQPGDRVMALVAGGGQAERAAVPEGQLLPIPDKLDFLSAAALPEAGLTAWTNLVAEGGLEAGESVLITAAASGVGTFAVQLARELGAKVLVAGRSLERLEPLRQLGASELVELGPDLPKQVRRATGGEGVQLVMEMAGGEHLPRSLEALAPRGRLVLVGLLAGRQAEVDLGLVLRHRLRLVGSVLRSRSRQEKAELVQAFGTFALPRLADGRLRPIVDRVLPFDRIADAY